ncbi:MAG: 30S ribosomal protein S12 methylthiotransferase RimO [Sandaracinaceae bacterium]|nr:30S ribosomal protein S12 methylthiotransferase RimO [Sandaracinaceae bacterium]
MSDAKTIHFLSLGCPKNRVDTEVMLGVSDQAGFRLVGAPEEAEVIVVNTCGFIGPAKEESIDAILEMGRFKEGGSCKRLVVAGCLSQRYPEELAAEMPEVDHFMGSSDMLKLRDVLTQDDEHKVARMLVGNPAQYSFRVTDPRRLSVASHSAYVKIAEGCNRTCSFCIIPDLRGKQRSRPIEDIVREVEMLVANGTVEINLVSQDTMSFGRDFEEKKTLAELVRKVAEVPGLKWLRLFYLYPETLTDELVELLADHPVVVPYVDMPLQHAADSMLKRMRRGHGGPRLRRVVETLRTRVPNLTFRTAFIVGHPGETEEDFKELCDFVSWAEFDRVGVFRYSKEEGTRSHDMDADVPAKVSAARHRKLMSLQRPISRKKLKAMIGQDIEVLVEGESDESEYLLEGRHRGQAPEIDGKIYLANGTAKPGTLMRARITAAADYDLVADLHGEDGAPQAPPPGAKRVKRAPVRLRTLAG